MRSQYKSKFAKKQAAKKRSNPTVYRAKAKKRVAKYKTTKRSVVVPTRLKPSSGYMSQSSWFVKSRPSKAVKTLELVGMPNTYTANSQSIIENHGGCYALGQVPHQDNTDLTNVFELIPTGQSTGMRRMVLESYTGVLNYTNLSNAPVELELYDIVLKKDLPSLQTVEIGANNFAIAGNPVSYICTGINANSLGPSSSGSPENPLPNSLMYGTSIFDSTLFKDYFKVIKRTIVEMPGGSTHAHTVSLKSNRILHQAEVTSETIAGIRGVNSWTIALMRTFGAISTSVAQPVALAYTTSPSRVSCQYSQRYKWTYAQDLASSNLYTNTMFRVPDPTTALYNLSVQVPQTGVASRVNDSAGNYIYPNGPV